MSKRRYTVTLDAYIWADNDDQAKYQAAKMSEFLRTLDDNQAQTVRLDETPFASLDSRLVHEGRIEIYNSKMNK